MKKVSMESLFDINFLSQIDFSEDGKYGSFVVSKGDVEDNNYGSNIYILNTENKNIMKLTTFNEERSAVWLDNENIIFPGARLSKDKEDIKKGMTKTVFNKINIHGGESQKYFEIPIKVSSILPINEDKYIVNGVFDNNLPDTKGLSDEEKMEKLSEYNENKKAYSEFDEIPFWFNGRGITNKLRDRLFIFDRIDNELKPISNPLMNITDYYYDKKSNRILFMGTEFKTMKGEETEIFIYDIEKDEVKEIKLDEDYTISFGYIIDEKLVFYGISVKEKTSYINSRFYRVGLDGGKPELLNNDDFSIGNSVGSDCNYGGGKSVRFVNDTIYYISTRGYNSYLFAFDKDGNESIISANMEGTIDSFDIHGDKALFIGVRDRGLNEIYALDTHTREEEKLTEYNKEWLEEHNVSYPEHFLMTTRDGVELDGFGIKPVDFDKNKTYPAILDIHGGPKTTYGNVLFHEMQLWANEGYFVIFTNPRGSNGKGSDFANIEGEAYTTVDYNDLMDFTDAALKEYPEIDKERLGVTGGSYGGLMTNFIVGQTNRFKSAATQRSITNFVSKCLTTDIGYIHNLRQMGGATPWDRVEIMWEKSPLKYVDKVETPLLFIHSDEDYRCYMADAFQMFTGLQMHGVETKMCLFHGENHGLSRGGKPKNRIKRLDEITKWMDKYLK